MKFKITKISLLSLLLFTACDKYLEVDPDNRAILNSPQAARELLATAYPQASYVMMSESMSDNFTDKGPFGGSVVNPVNRDVYKFIENIQSNGEDSPDFYWAACYKAIAAANQTLKYIEEQKDAKELLPYKGEALLCRAYAHFMLSVFFARPYNDVNPEANPGIPYVTEVEDVVIKKYERGNVKELYEKIQQDIETGIPLINDDAIANTDATAYHFTKRSAQAFATRFYLFKKDYEAVKKYSKLVFPGNDIISNSIRDVAKYKILPYYVLEQTWSSTAEPTNLLMATTPSQINGYPYLRYGTNGAFATAFMWKTPPIPSTNYAWNLYGQENFYNIPKFRSYSFNQKNYNIAILLTADEVLFNWAEASIETGDYAKALELFNLYIKKKLITNRSSIPDLTEENLKEAFKTGSTTLRYDYYIAGLLDFKRREFAFEGMRWLDMIRHRIPVHHIVQDEAAPVVVGANDPRRILQIPLEVQMSGVERNLR
ncbi:RagB/SusD family nutrient uptake outer membrane protein [Sphingobacterium kyonggiense]